MSIFRTEIDFSRVSTATGVDEALSVHGSDWLWAVTAIYIMAFIGLLVLSFTAKENERVFHYLFTCALLVGAITYYAQAADLGWSAVEQVDDLGNGVVRQIFYAKYVNWVFAFPCLALAFGLVSGVSWTTIFCNIVITWIWVVSYLLAAYTTSDYKWGFFAFGTLSWLILALSTLNESREAATRLGIGKDYIILAGWLNVLWVLYPIAFALSDGGNIISITGSFIFYGILDVLMTPVLSFAILLFGRNWDYRKLSIDFSDGRPSRRSEPSTETHLYPTAAA